MLCIYLGFHFSLGVLKNCFFFFKYTIKIHICNKLSQYSFKVFTTFFSIPSNIYFFNTSLPSLLYVSHWCLSFSFVRYLFILLNRPQKHCRRFCCFILFSFCIFSSSVQLIFHKPQVKTPVFSH